MGIEPVDKCGVEGREVEGREVEGVRGEVAVHMPVSRGVVVGATLPPWLFLTQRISNCFLLLF